MAFHVHLGFFSLHPFPSRTGGDGGLPEHPEASQGVHRAKGAMWKMGKMDEKSIEVGEVYPVFPTNPFLDSEDRPTRGTLVVMHELKTYPHIQGLQGRWATSPTSADGGHCFFRTAISRGKLWQDTMVSRSKSKLFLQTLPQTT